MHYTFLPRLQGAKIYYKNLKSMTWFYIVETNVEPYNIREVKHILYTRIFIYLATLINLQSNYNFS